MCEMDHRLLCLPYILLLYQISNALSWNYTEPMICNLSISFGYNQIPLNIIMLNTIEIEPLTRETRIPSGNHECANNSYNFWYYHDGGLNNNITAVVIKPFGGDDVTDCLDHISKVFANRNLPNITLSRCLRPDGDLEQTIETLVSSYTNATTIHRIGRFQTPDVFKSGDNLNMESSWMDRNGSTFKCSIVANMLLNILLNVKGEPLGNPLGNHSNILRYECGQCNANEFQCMTYAMTLNATEATLNNQWHSKDYSKAQRIVYALANDNVTIKCELFEQDHSQQSIKDYGLLWFKHTDNRTTEQFYDFINTRNVQLLPPLRGNTTYFLNFWNVQAKDESWYTCLNANNESASTYLKILQFNHISLGSGENPSTQSSSSSSSSFVVDGHSNVRNTQGDDEDASGTITLINEPLSNNKLKYLRSMYELHGLQENHTSAPQFKNVKRLEDHVHKPSGSSVQLMCPAIGNPTPNITWTRNNLEIQRTIGKVTYKRWYIQMDDATTEDSGIYKCTVCNLYGCIEHSTKLSIRDRLRSPPIISDKFPQNQTVLVNNSTYLECRVVSDLEPSIKWFKYERSNESTFVSIKQLEVNALKYVNKNTVRNTTTIPKVIALAGDPDRPSILNFTKVNYEDEGWYTCIASNTLGHTLESAYLRVVDKLMQKELIFHGRPMWITSITIVVLLLFLLGTVFIIYVLRKLKHEKLLKERVETFHQWTKKVIIYRPPIAEIDTCGLQIPVIKIEKQRTTFTTSSGSDAMQAFNEYEFPLDSNWEIPRNCLSLGSILGEGAFGRVVMAEANGLSHQMSNGTTGNTTIVAVKMVKEEHTDTDMTSLVHEMEVMKIIGKHINIINLLGCCSQNGPLWVIVEFAVHGNLKDFLKKSRSNSLWSNNTLTKKSNSTEYSEENPVLTEKHLTSFAFQIARGMEYLASRRCIHRDLAARNVLVSENLVMKIADFGLARDVQDTNYYRKNTNGRLPIKWMAPESLQDKFYDSKSDVWSYGVLLWEIMTYGEQPYPNIMSAEELYSYLLTGQRMEKPDRCSLNIYMLMRQCWHFKSSVRPTFTEIVENLEKIIELSSLVSNEGYLNLSVPLLETPPSSSDDESTADSNQKQYHQEEHHHQQQQTLKNNYQYTYKFN